MLLSRLAPAIFVFLWSTGWVTAKFAVEHSGPISFLVVRFVLSALLLWVICMALKVPMPKSRRGIIHAIVSGIFMQGLYLGMIWWAIGEGVPASIGGIIAGLQPLLTGGAAYILLHERLSPIQISGLILGFLGIFIAVLPKALALEGGDAAIPLYAIVINMIGMLAITYGTIYQKRYVHNTHVLAAVFWQYIGGALVVLPFAMLVEGFRYDVTLQSTLVMAWAVGAISIGAVLLLVMLINRGQVSRAASLIYLVPPLAAIEAWILFDERITFLMVVGTIIAVVGVYLTNRQQVRY